MKQYIKFLTTFMICLPLVTAAHAAIYQKQQDHALPTCDNQYLLHNVTAAVDQYNQQNPPANLYEKKQQLLLLKDFKGFSEVAADNFTSEENFNVSSKLVSLKINNKLINEDIRVCKSTSQGPAKDLFLIIYPKDYEILIDLVNFNPRKDNFLIKFSTRY